MLHKIMEQNDQINEWNKILWEKLQERAKKHESKEEEYKNMIGTIMNTLGFPLQDGSSETPQLSNPNLRGLAKEKPERHNNSKASSKKKHQNLTQERDKWLRVLCDVVESKNKAGDINENQKKLLNLLGGQVQNAPQIGLDIQNLLTKRKFRNLAMGKSQEQNSQINLLKSPDRSAAITDFMGLLSPTKHPQQSSVDFDEEGASMPPSSPCIHAKDEEINSPTEIKAEGKETDLASDEAGLAMPVHPPVDLDAFYN